MKAPIILINIFQQSTKYLHSTKGYPTIREPILYTHLVFVGFFIYKTKYTGNTLVNFCDLLSKFLIMLKNIDKYNTWAYQYDNDINPARDLDNTFTIKSLSNIDFFKVFELDHSSGKIAE